MRRVEVNDKEYLIRTQSGMRLIQALREQGIPIDCQCSNNGQHSSQCEVKFPRDTAFLLSAPTPLEEEVLGSKIEKGFRLACQALFK